VVDWGCCSLQEQLMHGSFQSGPDIIAVVQGEDHAAAIELPSCALLVGQHARSACWGL
jgi:hypothetical protein